MLKVRILVFKIIIRGFSFQFISISFIVISGPTPVPPPNPLPNILYKILTSAPPSPFPDVLPISDREARDGYVHLARALNILPVAMKTYNYTLQLWALKLNYKWMRENHYDIRSAWDTSNTTFFPKLYHNITKQMLLDIKMWTRTENETWDQTSLVNDKWLTDGNTATSFNPGRIERIVLQLLCIALSFYFISF